MAACSAYHSNSSMVVATFEVLEGEVLILYSSPMEISNHVLT